MGNFLECLKFLAYHNKTIKRVVLKNSPENLILTLPKIQKDIVNVATVENAQAIIYELGDAPFALLVDESHDISMKEQIVVVLRYVDKHECVIEHFLAIKHVTNTIAQSLKVAIEAIFSKHGLSITSFRGQGYDGASNIQGKFNSLKTLIQNDNPAAFYVHCFAHQLQLTLIAIAKIHEPICIFFKLVYNLLNCIGFSRKRHDMLQIIQAAKAVDILNSGELQSGQGLNQETLLKRPRDTRWGSHYVSLVNLIHMFSSVVDVLGIILKDHSSEQRSCTGYLLTQLESFDFAFKMHMMKNIFAITSELSKALQRKDQDIVNAKELVKIMKQQFQMMRDDGWHCLLSQVHSFCNKHEISILNMDDLFVGRQR